MNNYSDQIAFLEKEIEIMSSQKLIVFEEYKRLSRLAIEKQKTLDELNLNKSILSANIQKIEEDIMMYKKAARPLYKALLVTEVAAFSLEMLLFAIIPGFQVTTLLSMQTSSLLTVVTLGSLLYLNGFQMTKLLKMDKVIKIQKLEAMEKDTVNLTKEISLLKTEKKSKATILCNIGKNYDRCFKEMLELTALNEYTFGEEPIIKKLTKDKETESWKKKTE